MKAKIARVLLWPKSESVKPPYREVPFDMKGVEVVTGGSQRGKSALIPIIDYCLGSEHCRIPIGLIRDSVGWFGVELRLAVVDGVIGSILTNLRTREEWAKIDVQEHIPGLEKMTDAERSEAVQDLLIQVETVAEIESCPITTRRWALF